MPLRPCSRFCPTRSRPVKLSRYVMPCRRTSEHFGPFRRKLPEDCSRLSQRTPLCVDASAALFALCQQEESPQWNHARSLTAVTFSVVTAFKY
jgi:hypothetical protein